MGKFYSTGDIKIAKIAHEACCRINPEHPERVAENLREVFDFLIFVADGELIDYFEKKYNIKTVIDDPCDRTFYYQTKDGKYIGNSEASLYEYIGKQILSQIEGKEDK